MERNKTGQLLKGHKMLYLKKGKEHHQYKHGLYSTPIYKKWEGMKRRCLNTRDKAYRYYGGRGIKICNKWLIFIGFNEDMGKSFVKGMSLERIDNNKGYCKKNCKWILLNEQQKNRRNVRLYKFGNKILCSVGWDRELGLRKGTVRARIIKYGWDIQKAITTPKIKYKGYSKSRGKYMVEVKRNGKKTFVGRFNTEDEAIKAR